MLTQSKLVAVVGALLISGLVASSADAGHRYRRGYQPYPSCGQAYPPVARPYASPYYAAPVVYAPPVYAVPAPVYYRPAYPAYAAYPAYPAYRPYPGYYRGGRAWSVGFSGGDSYGGNGFGFGFSYAGR